MFAGRVRDFAPSTHLRPVRVKSVQVMTHTPVARFFGGVHARGGGHVVMRAHDMCGHLRTVTQSSCLLIVVARVGLVSGVDFDSVDASYFNRVAGGRFKQELLQI